MRNSKSIDSRLRHIEGKRGPATILLRFADATTRRVDVARDFHLKLFFDAAGRLRAYPPPMPSGAYPPTPPEPRTDSDELLDLMGEAESIDGPRYFQMLFAMCKQLHERKEAKKK